MSDLTQVPPFGPVAVITDGVVTGFAGWANAYWVEQQADPALVLAPDGTQEGDTYLDGQFVRPAPTQEDTDVA